MEYEDRITIPTPEGIELEYTLAGLGSRFIAELVDTLLRLVVLGALLGVLVAIGGGTLAAIGLIVATFLAVFAYDITFEVWAAGRTPGKRWNGLRVVMSTGQPVSFGPSAVRNLLRIVDMWGTALVAGIIAITVTKRNQRLGDLAAGTIVVRERRTHLATEISEPQEVDAGVDVTAVTASELAAVRNFLARRKSLTPQARARVSQALAAKLATKVGGLPPGDLPPERVLETIAAAKAASQYGVQPPGRI